MATETQRHTLQCRWTMDRSEGDSWTFPQTRCKSAKTLSDCSRKRNLQEELVSERHPCNSSTSCLTCWAEKLSLIITLCQNFTCNGTVMQTGPHRHTDWDQIHHICLQTQANKAITNLYTGITHLHRWYPRYEDWTHGQHGHSAAWAASVPWIILLHWSCRLS